MPARKKIRLVLAGNPNSGKSSLFNHLTGLHQKTGNFPGITVDKKTGFTKINEGLEAEIIDLPGTYSIFPKSLDEKVVADVLLNPENESYPDIVLVVVDSANLKRNLLIVSQLIDMKFPVIVALNMMDVAQQMGYDINSLKLSSLLKVPVIELNARLGIGVNGLKRAILQKTDELSVKETPYHSTVVSELKGNFSKLLIENPTQEEQTQDTIERYQNIEKIVVQCIHYLKPKQHYRWTNWLDSFLLHPLGGYLFFFLLLFLIFQAIFSWSSYPMDAIDSGMANLSGFLKEKLPSHWSSNLLTDGILPGITGIIVFVPQISFLFFFIFLLEETGYMSRVVFLMDKIMRWFGLNGRSVVPLISGAACAVPAIMATRNIASARERLITILVTPLMSCSARLPIYTIIIALIIPEKSYFGFLSLQTVALLVLYWLGFMMALISAFIFQKLKKTNEKSYFIMELPAYKVPRFSQIGLNIFMAVKSFLWGAGKVILAISVILWALSNYGPNIQDSEKQVIEKNPTLSQTELPNAISAQRLENSYAGRFGKLIEPVIKPLGYDWKIGIALLTSFAAREVFVGTMSTIYSLGESHDQSTTLKERMRAEINPITKKPFYTPALGFSLLIFYAFAMQCMSTLATTYRETKHWKYPVFSVCIYDRISIRDGIFGLSVDEIMLIFKPFVIHAPQILRIFTGKFTEAIALFPFIIVAKRRSKNDEILLNHEKIHLIQQIELLIFPFYVWYFLEYLWHRFKGKSHFQAYLNIRFEREAYTHEHDLNYLAKRKFWGWI